MCWLIAIIFSDDCKDTYTNCDTAKDVLGPDVFCGTMEVAKMVCKKSCKFCWKCYFIFYKHNIALNYILMKMLIWPSNQLIIWKDELIENNALHNLLVRRSYNMCDNAQKHDLYQQLTLCGWQLWPKMITHRNCYTKKIVACYDYEVLTCDCQKSFDCKKRCIIFHVLQNYVWIMSPVITHAWGEPQYLH